MALFGKNKQSEEKESASAEASSERSFNVITEVIIRPRVTEKSHTMATESNVFMFEVAQNASKGKVAQAIYELYKVKPVKVSVVPIPRKSRIVRGKVGYSGGGRKAYVYLKEGDKIE
jgi:large subunit ribosomal protein L23